MTKTWDSNIPGVLQLPSGRFVRGRALKRPLPSGQKPTFALYLLGNRPPAVVWKYRWIRWPDFWLPTNYTIAADAFYEAWTKAEYERVEIACNGGFGRTGTALACLAVIDGVPNSEAVAYIRQHYARRAVETPWQRYYVSRFQQ